MDLQPLFIPFVITLMGSFAVVLATVALISRETSSPRKR